MASYSRLMFCFLMLSCAAAAVAALLWTAAPAVAADSAVPAGHTAGKTAPVASSHHSRYDPRLSAIRSNLGCSGVWCGRQFVLMVGVAY
jgi:hypothetical protein